MSKGAYGDNKPIYALLSRVSAIFMFCSLPLSARNSIFEVTMSSPSADIGIHHEESGRIHEGTKVLGAERGGGTSCHQRRDVL